MDPGAAAGFVTERFMGPDLGRGWGGARKIGEIGLGLGITGFAIYVYSIGTRSWCFCTILRGTLGGSRSERRRDGCNIDLILNKIDFFRGDKWVRFCGF